MKLILCLDDRNGVMFGGRRQSRDEAVCKKILQLVDCAALWMNDYSAKLFKAKQHRINVDADFLVKAQENDFCFVENADITQYLPRVQQLVVFRWHRHYPADVYFTGLHEWKRIVTEDFSGNSHDRITMEVYGK